MKEIVSRRSFLRTSAIAFGSLCAFSLAGCTGARNESNAQSSGSSSSGNASNTDNSEGSSSNMDSSNTSSQASSDSGSVAVVYFSCTGTTQRVAEKIAQATDGKLIRIEPAQPYSSADLDWTTDCRANDEQNDPGSRPQIANQIDLAGYDTVYLGYPIWWGTAPHIILTLLEGQNLQGKTVVPFCTSGGSPLSGSISDMETAASNANWVQGQRFAGSVSQSDIDAWVNSVQ